MRNSINENRNKYALVTGATSGIGFEITRLLAKDGFNLFLVARGDELLENITSDLKEQYGVEVTPIVKDLFESNAAKEIYEEVKSRGVEIDILVNDAGQGEWGKFVETDLGRQLEVIQLNVCSLVSLTHYFLKDMVARNEGKILQLGSEVSKSPMPYMAVYAATKAFVLSFSEAIMNELKDTDVTITVLMPGATDTDFFHKAEAEHTKVYQEELLPPADVAKDGYDALMKGERRIISGMKTKLHVASATIMSDKASAANLGKSMKPAKEKKKQKSGHSPSRKERETINANTQKGDGDY